MPEVKLCRYCKQPVDKEADKYIIVDKGTDRHPEVLAHVECEQKRPSGVGIEEWLKALRWPFRS